MQLIDWVTVVAQIVNFLILVALLKYFLYGRVLAAIQNREQSLVAQRDAAERDRADAAEQLQAARNKNRELDEQRDRLFAVVRDEVEAYRKELTGKVRADVEHQQSRWTEALREESNAFLRDLRQRASQEVCVIARRALADLANRDLEECIVQSFLERVQQLGDQARDEVIASLREGMNVAIVQTSLELPDALKENVSRVLRQQFADNVEIRFEQTADLICGIALHTDAHKLAWELGDYLADLEKELHQALNEEVTVNRVPRGSRANLVTQSR